MFSIKKICNLLNISIGTFNNWQKEGLIPDFPKDCDDEIFYKYCEIISKNVAGKLSSRANRCTSQTKYIVYQGIVDTQRKQLLRKLIYKFNEANVSIEVGVISLLINILKTSQIIDEKFFLTPHSRIEKDLKIWCEDICVKTHMSFQKIEEVFAMFAVEYKKDDILGAFYQSVQCIADKSIKGSFYTPTELLTSIKCEKNKSVYDPCCGSGNILTNVISSQHDDNLIYASDIDEIALKICETNLVLFFHNPNIRSHIFKNDILQQEETKIKYDIVVTNPPWGAKFPVDQKAQLKRKYFQLSSTESSAIALFVCQELLSEKGMLYIFLPESLLNVKTHINIRKFLLDLPYKLQIDILENAFKKVFSKAILLSIDKKKSLDNIFISTKSSSYLLDKKECKSPYYFITAQTNQQDLSVIKKIYEFSHQTLANNAIFALGIVTGDNKRYLTYEFSENLEPIYRGKNIEPYFLTPSNEYMLFDKQKFQQVASIDLYRKRKIVYKFISNKIVCCISENGELFLNSANMFIPTIDYPLETIVVLFNSKIYEFLYKKMFNSIKVLRSHIELLPLPNFTKEQHSQIKNSYLSIQNHCYTQDEADKLLASFLHLSSQDFSIIQNIK